MSDKFAPVPFPLEDSDGVSHDYVTVRHSGEAGLPVALKIGAVVSRPMVAGLGAVLGTGSLKDLTTGNVNFEKLDVDAVGLAVEAVLGSKEAPALVKQILANTTRDGKKLAGTGLDCYAGNYLELVWAIKEVVRINGFLPLPDISTILAKVKSTIGSSGSGNAPTTEASTPS